MNVLDWINFDTINLGNTDTVYKKLVLDFFQLYIKKDESWFQSKIQEVRENSFMQYMSWINYGVNDLRKFIDLLETTTSVNGTFMHSPNLYLLHDFFELFFIKYSSNTESRIQWVQENVDKLLWLLDWSK